jgi:membrane protease YdiL (CAAX protease family)
MIAITIMVAIAIILIDLYVRSVPHLEKIVAKSPWILATLVHIPQFIIPFGFIYFLSRGKIDNYGFNLHQKPPVFTHRRMLYLGVACGMLLSFQHIVRAFKGIPLDIPYPVTMGNVLGNMIFQWIIVGLTEETMFRGLIQTYLMDNLTGSHMILGHQLHIGTIIGAILWGAFHFINCLIMPIGPVMFTVIFTTFAGLLMGYAFQETRSLLTTAIVHNTLFGVALTTGYILYLFS